MLDIEKNYREGRNEKRRRMGATKYKRINEETRSRNGIHQS
jgi:hypothetical protein